MIQPVSPQYRSVLLLAPLAGIAGAIELVDPAVDELVDIVAFVTADSPSPLIRYLSVISYWAQIGMPTG